MNYYCLEENRHNLKKFVKSIFNKILSINEHFNRNYDNLKSSTKLDSSTTMYISRNQEKKQLKQYVVSLFNYLTFKNYISNYLQFININIIEDEILKYFRFYKCNIIDEKLNIGYKFKKDILSGEIFFHEWCTLINKFNYNESRFFFTTRYITDEIMNSLKGEINISFEKNKNIIIKFVQDSKENYSKFEYKIIHNSSLNYFTLFSSEIKYETQENKMKNFIWKKSKYEKNDEKFYLEETFQSERNVENNKIYENGTKYEKCINDSDISELKDNWSKNDEKNEVFKKTTTITRPKGTDSYYSTTIVTCYSDLSNRHEEHFEKKDETGNIKKGKTEETFKDNLFSKCSFYYLDDKRKIHEEWWKNGNEVQSSKYEQDKIIRKNKTSGYKIENEEKIYEFSDTYVENLEEHSNYSIRNGYSKIDGNHWKSTTSTKANEHLVEKWGKNELEKKEWFEKWLDSKEEKYSYKWGKDQYNEWKEEWKDIFDENGHIIEKTCYKTNMKLFDHYEWFETWSDKYENNKLIEKNCQKWNKSESSFYENKWGEILVNREENLWKNYAILKKNGQEDSWVRYFNKVV